MACIKIQELKTSKQMATSYCCYNLLFSVFFICFLLLCGVSVRWHSPPCRIGRTPLLRKTLPDKMFSTNLLHFCLPVLLFPCSSTFIVLLHTLCIISSHHIPKASQHYTLFSTFVDNLAILVVTLIVSFPLYSRAYIILSFITVFIFGTRIATFAFPRHPM